jgi:hypothetical protein
VPTPTKREAFIVYIYVYNTNIHSIKFLNKSFVTINDLIKINNHCG